jgi:hypothetical protein
MTEMRETALADDPDAALERALMEEFLSDQGLTFEELLSLDDDRRQRLMMEATLYAALRLGERAYLGNRRES